jgi:[ribosomal protein S5]-alanine N-acetyltransferase
LGSDEATNRWIPALPAGDATEVTECFERWRCDGEMLHLVIADRAADAYIGEVVAILGEHRVAELGCAVVPSARRQGVASEALRLVALWGFAVLGLARAHVFVAQQNTIALRLAERAGFRREGTLRSYFEIDGVRLDAVVLSRLPGDDPLPHAPR